MVQELGVPEDLVLLIKNLYVNSRGILKPGTPGIDGIFF